MAGEVRFTIVRKMLEQAGYRLVRVNGSHHIFEKPGEQSVSIPVHRKKVKQCYVRKIEKAIRRD
jgi:predicted RNA binding protein YcfA (HicA-like mRNA interferase family)